MNNQEVTKIDVAVRIGCYLLLSIFVVLADKFGELASDQDLAEVGQIWWIKLFLVCMINFLNTLRSFVDKSYSNYKEGKTNGKINENEAKPPVVPVGS